MLTVACLKWGRKYGSEYVLRLQSMVERHLTVPHEFVCVTDDAIGLAGVDTLPCSDGLEGWWNKLRFFADKPFGLSGRLLFLDLDIVVIRSLDEMVSCQQGFVIIRDFMKPTDLNSSVFLLDVGHHTEVWERFDLRSIGKLYGDQDWISKVFRRRDVAVWPDDWCISYRLNSKGAYPLEPTKIVVFHGDPKPKAVEHIPWIKENWQ